MLNSEKNTPGKAEAIDEFAEFNKIKFSGSTIIGQKSPMCNRYSNILPFDENVVLLRTAQHQYINASFTDRNTASFILTQAPLQETIESFWAMVYEYQTIAIVKLVEFVVPDSEGWSVCHPYIPPAVGKTSVFGNFSVTLNQRFIAPSFSKYQGKQKEPLSYSSLTVQYTKWRSGTAFPSATHSVLLIENNSWPDHSIPNTPLHILWISYNLYRYSEKLRIEREKQPQPPIPFTVGFDEGYIRKLNKIKNDSGNSIRNRIVVHCSAGVGRTGCFAVVHSALTFLYEILDKYLVVPLTSTPPEVEHEPFPLPLPLTSTILQAVTAADEGEEDEKGKGKQGPTSEDSEEFEEVRFSTVSTILPDMWDLVDTVKSARCPRCVESYKQYAFCIDTVAIVFNALGCAQLLPKSYKRSLPIPPSPYFTSTSLLSVFFQPTQYANPRVKSYVELVSLPSKSPASSSSSSPSSGVDNELVTIHPDLPPPLI